MASPRPMRYAPRSVGLVGVVGLWGVVAGGRAHFRIRHDTVDRFGKLTLRHDSRLHHLGIGITHAHTPGLILVASHTITVISKTSHHSSAATPSTPTKTIGATNRKTPADGRGQSVTHDATHP
jgi:hypothetical protein